MDKRLLVAVCWISLIGFSFGTGATLAARFGTTGCNPSVTSTQTQVGALSGCNSMPPHPTVSPTASATLECDAGSRPEANCNWSHRISGYWLNPNNNTWT